MGTVTQEGLDKEKKKFLPLPQLLGSPGLAAFTDSGATQRIFHPNMTQHVLKFIKDPQRQLLDLCFPQTLIITP